MKTEVLQIMMYGVFVGYCFIVFNTPFPLHSFTSPAQIRLG